MIVLPEPGARAPAVPRWALSFADLCLVLLAFLLLVQAHHADPAALGAGLRRAFGGAAPQTAELRTAPLFAPGEAILTPPARARFAALGATAARAHARVRIESLGRDGGGRRFDAWELAAARTAAIARAIAACGVADGRIDVALDAGSGPASGQRVRLTLDP